MDFDPTFGYTRDQLLAAEAPPPPDDFEAFWRDTYRLATANAVPAAYRIMRILEVGHAAPTEKDQELEKEIEEIKKQMFLL